MIYFQRSDVVDLSMISYGRVVKDMDCGTERNSLFVLGINAGRGKSPAGDATGR